MTPKTMSINGKMYALVPVKPSVPVVVSPDPKIECIEPGCYKEGHLFSPRGAFGTTAPDGTLAFKGHFTLNPTHAFKTH